MAADARPFHGTESPTQHPHEPVSSRGLERRKFLIAAGGVASSAFLAACGGSKTGATSTNVKAKVGGTLRWDTAVEPKDLNPIGAGAAVTAVRRVNAWVTNGLLRLSDQPDQYINDLAVSLQPLDGGKRWRVGLRPGVLFSDGSPLTATDVKGTYDAVLNPATGSNWTNQVAVLQSVKVVDSHTVDFLLTEPNVWMRNAFAQIPILKATQANDANTLAQKPIGTGPFMVTSVVSGDRVVLARNPHYFRAGRPKIDTIDYVVVQNPSTLLIDLANGTAGLSSDVPYSQLGLAERRNVKIYDISGAPARQYFYFNVNKEPWFRDKNFRNALSYAIDRQRICQLVFGGKATPAQGQYSDNTIYYDPSLTKFGPGPDLAKAKSMLAAAAAKPNRPLVMTTLGNDPILVAAATIMQANWRALGVDLQIETPDQATAVQKIVGKTFDMALINDFLGTGPGFTPTYIFTSYGSKGRFNFAAPNAAEDARLDAIIAQARSAQSQSAVQQACRQLQQFDLDEQRVVATCYPHYIEAQGVPLVNYQPVRAGNVPYSVEDASLGA